MACHTRKVPYVSTFTADNILIFSRAWVYYPNVACGTVDHREVKKIASYDTGDRVIFNEKTLDGVYASDVFASMSLAHIRLADLLEEKANNLLAEAKKIREEYKVTEPASVG